MDQGLLIVLSGFSGAGKGTIVKELMKRYPEQYALSVSVTTRQPRDGEVEGISYFFRTQEEFDAIKAADGFLEDAGYVNHSYGTPKEYVMNKLAEGKNTIAEIEMVGAHQLKEKYPQAYTIFVTAPNVAELKRRLLKRNTEKPKVIEERLLRAEEEAKGIDWYDYILVNDDLDTAVEELHRIIMARKQCLRFIRETEKDLHELNGAK
ncbi:MAG: guanylate kinase [Lachnospiraceae bacterium]